MKVLCGLFWLLVLITGVFIAGWFHGYRAGQIDAATGHQHYHLTTQPDQTSRWERKD